MNVFEVITELTREDGNNEIVMEKQYITSEDNSIKTVTEYFCKYCDEYGGRLVSVRDVLTIVQHIECSTKS